MKDLAKRLALRLSVLAQAVLFQTAWGEVSPNVDKGDARPLVVCTAYVVADMTEVIGGDVIRVETSVPPRSGVRDDAWELYLNQLFDRADLVLVDGPSAQVSLLWLLPDHDRKGSLRDVTDGIEYLPSLSQVRSANPPAWMNARNGKTYASNIYHSLAAAFPDYADQFAFNYGIYRQEIEAVDTWIRDTLRTLPQRHSVLRASGDAMLYFARGYGLRVRAHATPQSDGSGNTLTGGRAVDKVDGSLDEEMPTYLALMRRTTRVIAGELDGNPDGHARGDGLKVSSVAWRVFIALFILIVGIGALLRTALRSRLGRG